MDLSSNAVVSKVLPEFVATGTENGEYMVYRIAIGENYSHEGIAYFSLIASGNLTTALVGSIEMREFCQEDGGLDFVHAAVATQVVEDVMTSGAVIAHSTDDLGQFVVISGHSTSIAKRTQIFRGVEAMAGCGA